MNYFAVMIFVASATAGRLENTYLPPNGARSAGGSASFLNTPSKSVLSTPTELFNSPTSGSIVGAKSYSIPSSAPIAILRLNNDNNGDGKYNYDFETENHISQQESGQLGNAGGEEAIVAQGAYSFEAPDGKTYTIRYIADENGFQAQGAHIPTGPSIPEEILKALEQNAADEAAGIFDDGQYRPDQSERFADRTYLAPKSGSVQQNGGYKY